MRKELIPYYLSRAVFSALVGLLIGLKVGPWWMGLLTGVLIFAGFIWYAHSGRYLIDTSRPLTPLRRDERGKRIRDRSAVAAVAIAGVVYGGLGLLVPVFPVENTAAWAALAGVIVYFAVSNWYYARQ